MESKGWPVLACLGGYLISLRFVIAITRTVTYRICL